MQVYKYLTKLKPMRAWAATKKEAAADATKKKAAEDATATKNKNYFARLRSRGRVIPGSVQDVLGIKP